MGFFSVTQWFYFQFNAINWVGVTPGKYHMLLCLMEEKCVCGGGTEWRGNTQGSWACIEKLDLLLINPVLRRISQTHWRREFWCLRTSDHLYHCDQSISQKTPYPWRIKIQLEFCWEQTHSGHNIFFDTHLSISFFSGPLMAMILFSALIILSVCNDTHKQCHTVPVSPCLAF